MWIHILFVVSLEQKESCFDDIMWARGTRSAAPSLSSSTKTENNYVIVKKQCKHSMSSSINIMEDVKNIMWRRCDVMWEELRKEIKVQLASVWIIWTNNDQLLENYKVQDCRCIKSTTTPKMHCSKKQTIRVANRLKKKLILQSETIKLLLSDFTT